MVAHRLSTTVGIDISDSAAILSAHCAKLPVQNFCSLLEIWNPCIAPHEERLQGEIGTGTWDRMCCFCGKPL